LQNDFETFFETEIADRRKHDYPPFTRLIEITVKHTDKKICQEASRHLGSSLREQLSRVKVLGPGEPMISKIRNLYLMSILLKMVRGKSDLIQVKGNIQNNIDALLKEQSFRNVRIIVDVDPV
jgi:primosomal protein N' (replication factor Y)